MAPEVPSRSTWQNLDSLIKEKQHSMAQAEEVASYLHGDVLAREDDPCKWWRGKTPIGSTCKKVPSHTGSLASSSFQCLGQLGPASLLPEHAFLTLILLLEWRFTSILTIFYQSHM